MDEPSVVVDRWQRRPCGAYHEHEEVQIVRQGRAYRVRVVGKVHTPDRLATNESHAYQLANRLLVGDWERVPSRAPEISYGQRPGRVRR